MLVRRFLVLQSLLLWQGGFLFYALVVVPIGTDFLGSATQQGFVTQRVTHWLNRIGWFALAILAMDALATAPRRRLRFWLVVVATILNTVLTFGLHGTLSERLDFEEHRIREREGFYSLHRWYLIVSGVQWFLVFVFSILTLSAWRAHDGHPGAALRILFNRR
jgi:hypothetical protein